MAPNITTTTTTTTVTTEPVSKPSKAYVTFLAGNGDYVKGVVGLAKGLRKVKTKYPLVVAILPDVPEDHREILVSQGCIVREIEPVYPPENQTQFAMAYYVINYSKLRIWEVCILVDVTILCLHVWLLTRSFCFLWVKRCLFLKPCCGCGLLTCYVKNACEGIFDCFYEKVCVFLLNIWGKTLQNVQFHSVPTEPSCFMNFPSLV